jgi:cyclic pyranopterin phosphate synthase
MDPNTDDQRLSHLDESGEARMVDVGDKLVTARRARARAVVRMQAATARLIETDSGPKGAVLAVARIAGIQAAKRTAELIPLCHPLSLEKISVDFRWLESPAGMGQLEVTTEAAVTAKTGVEMEALTAAALAALTVYDMCKAVDRSMEITEIGLVEKVGGRSGEWHAARPAAEPRRGSDPAAGKKG